MAAVTICIDFQGLENIVTIYWQIMAFWQKATLKIIYYTHFRKWSSYNSETSSTSPSIIQLVGMPVSVVVSHLHPTSCLSAAGQGRVFLAHEDSHAVQFSSISGRDDPRPLPFQVRNHERKSGGKTFSESLYLSPFNKGRNVSLQLQQVSTGLSHDIISTWRAHRVAAESECTPPDLLIIYPRTSPLCLNPSFISPFSILVK